MDENQQQRAIRMIRFQPIGSSAAFAVPNGRLPELCWIGEFAALLWSRALNNGKISVETRAHEAPRRDERAGMGGASHVMTASGPQDEAARRLVGHLDSGDPEGFAALFALYRDELRRLCGRMLYDSASVDDALNEIFLRAHRALPQFDREKPFRPWLRALATHHCIDQLRRQRTERGIFDAGEFGEETAADNAPDALRGITQREERKAVLDALDALPEKFRLPLVLRFYQDLDYDGIAAILGVTKNQVGTLLFRGKARLRSEILARSGSGPSGEERRTDG